MRLLDSHAVVRLLILCAAALASCAAQTPPPDPPAGSLEDPSWLGPFVPTPEPIVSELLRLSRPGERDVVFDLGSGDGRVIIAAAEQFGARAVGIEWNERLCAETEAAIRAAGLEDRIRVIQGDIFEQDLRPANVVTAYLLPKSWDRLKPLLEEQLAPGSRVVSVNADVNGWQAVEERVLVDDKGVRWELRLYRM